MLIHFRCPWEGLPVCSKQACIQYIVCPVCCKQARIQYKVCPVCCEQACSQYIVAVPPMNSHEGSTCRNQSKYNGLLSLIDADGFSRVVLHCKRSTIRENFRPVYSGASVGSLIKQLKIRLALFSPERFGLYICVQRPSKAGGWPKNNVSPLPSVKEINVKN